MSRRLKLTLGIEGDLHEVEVVIPDDEPTPWAWGDQLSVVGHREARLDGPAKATGNARYTYDIDLPGMLYGAILRSPYPNARVRDVDLSRALKLDGVRAAIRLDDGEARFAGQEVAAVAARTSDVARDALRLIKVDYEPLKFAATLETAAASDAPAVYEGRSNLASPKIYERGNVRESLAHAAAAHEAVYTTAVQTHVSLETHGAVASWEGDKLTLYSSTQGIFTVRDDVAVHFDLPHENVRVITEYLGGGFGSKLGVGPETIVAARLAKGAGAPVKLMLTRPGEHLATGNRPDSEQKVRLGVDSSGKLVAVELVQRGSGGIGAGSGSSGPFQWLYRCANVRTEERNVYTNTGPSAPMRAPGWPQGTFALELAIDELARKQGIDRLEFRRRNNDDRVRATEFEIGARAFGWSERVARPKGRGAIRRGIGVASSRWFGLGIPGPQALAVAHRDGRVEIQIGTQDIGTGTRTVVAMVAAEELGLPLARVTPVIGDTRLMFSVPSGGSMSSPSDTPAVRQAAAHLKEKLLALAAPILNAEPGDLEMRDGMIRVRFDPTRSIAFDEACRRIPADSISAEGSRVANYAGFRENQAGCQFAEVEVDIETGVTRVIQVVAVHDAGRIVNPLTARSQVNGGVLMGISFALFEARRMDPILGIMVNPTMDDYKLVGSVDTPEIKVMFVEVANGVTNTGVVGLGEAAHTASAAAVACAVSDAIDAPVRALPMTPDRIFEAMEARRT